MAKDPVCGMQVDENKAAGNVYYKDRFYYFCSAACKGKFEKNPESIIKNCC
jgi:YHS domain-containing protein